MTNTIKRLILALLIWPVCASFLSTPEFGNAVTSAGSHKENKERFLLLDSSESDVPHVQVVVLLDKSTGDVIVLSTSEPSGRLQEIARNKTDMLVVTSSVVRVMDGTHLVVVGYSGEPLGNRTALVEVYDPQTRDKIFAEWSRLQPLIQDVNGDGRTDMVLYLDTQGFEHPRAPYWPIIYAFARGNVYKQRLEGDQSFATFIRLVKDEHIEFLSSIDADCKRTAEGKCSSFLEGERQKARRQLSKLEQLNRLLTNQ